jgi:hypothetical protein
MLFSVDQWMLACVSFSLGIFAKLADLMDEHGLPEHFPGAKILYGVLWGLSGVGMVYVSPLGGLTYIAHVLYWFQRVKLEFPNHALAGVMMVLSGFYFQGEFLSSHRNDLLFVYLAYTLTGYFQAYFKTHFPSTRPFWRLRLRIYAIPIVYALYHQSLDPVIATGFGMIACELITYIYRAYKDDKVILQKKA